MKNLILMILPICQMVTCLGVNHSILISLKKCQSPDKSGRLKEINLNSLRNLRRMAMIRMIIWTWILVIMSLEGSKTEILISTTIPGKFRRNQSNPKINLKPRAKSLIEAERAM